MTEEEAREAVRAIVGPAGIDRLEILVAMIVAENERQNLIARSTVPTIWTRHVLDSVQLISWAGDGKPWLDIGTGGGFPGLAVAAVDDRPIVLVEPRKRRADFLAQVATNLMLGNVNVCHAAVERLDRQARVISARAVAPVEKLLQASSHCATAGTRWLLPRGQISAAEVDLLRRQTHMMFHVEQSLSDPASSVLIVERPAS